jgi:predicted dehydrogenase
LKPLFIEAHRLAPFTPRGTEVAVVLDLMIHDLDIILHLIDSPVKSVDASGVAIVSDSIDIANARIRFENGCVANLTASRISQKRMRKMRIFQKNTYLSIDFNGRASEVFELKTGADPEDNVLTEMGVGDRKKLVVYEKFENDEADALETEVNGFLAAVRGESNQGVSGEEGKEALSLALEILRMMEV